MSTITRNLTANVFQSTDKTQAVVEIMDDTTVVHTIVVPNKVGFVKRIDRELELSYFNRVTAWENLPNTRFTFKVDRYL